MYFLYRFSLSLSFCRGQDDFYSPVKPTNEVLRKGQFLSLYMGADE